MRQIFRIDIVVRSQRNKLPPIPHREAIEEILKIKLEKKPTIDVFGGIVSYTPTLHISRSSLMNGKR